MFQAMCTDTGMSVTGNYPEDGIGARLGDRLVTSHVS